MFISSGLSLWQPKGHLEVYIIVEFQSIPKTFETQPCPIMAFRSVERIPKRMGRLKTLAFVRLLMYNSY